MAVAIVCESDIAPRIGTDHAQERSTHETHPVSVE